MPRGARLSIIRNNNIVAVGQAASSEDKTYPESDFSLSFFQRLFTIVPLNELFICPKDHMYSYKQAWIISEQHDGNRIKSGLTFLFEMELLLSALFLGVGTTVYTGTWTEEIKENFVNYRYDTIDFYYLIFSTLSVLLLLFVVFAAYLMIQLLLPVSATNIGVWLKTSSVLRVLFIPNVLIVFGLYSFLLQIVLTTIKMGGASILITVLVVGLTAVIFIVISWNFGMAFNLAFLSGSFSSIPIFSNQRKMFFDNSSEECEQMLFNKCIQNKKEGLITDLSKIELFYKKIEERFRLEHPEEYNSYINELSGMKSEDENNTGGCTSNATKFSVHQAT
jgi:hypothetical protein